MPRLPPSSATVDPPELLVAAEAVAGADLKSQLLCVVIPSCLCCCENVWGCALKLLLISGRGRKDAVMPLSYGICILR
ncbi:uncharacterized protein DS421_17g589400 [Arachis hypogaea]|nr:uncharacterized protein DS421_17g589400 [Arachis hypogaea]